MPVGLFIPLRSIQVGYASGVFVDKNSVFKKREAK